MGEHSNMHRILIYACSRSGFLPNIAVQSNDIQCFEKLIASGIGIGISREKKLTASDADIDSLIVELISNHTIG